MKRILTVSAANCALQMGLMANVVAHTGHDHSHWSSPAVHALAVAALMAVVGAGVWLAKSKKSKALNKQREQ